MDAWEEDLGCADDLRFSLPMHRVLLVLLVPPVLLVQEVLVYVHDENFFYKLTFRNSLDCPLRKINMT